MKKVILCIICIAMALSVAACGGSNGAVKNVEGTLSEIFKKIYAESGVESPMLMEVAVDATNKASMLGSNDVTFTEGLASEAAIMTIPHSMVLIRVDKSVDVEKTKQLIRDNVNPRKWICVGVEADQVIVDSIGDLVFLVMSADAAAYHASFLKLAA